MARCTTLPSLLDNIDTSFVETVDVSSSSLLPVYEEKDEYISHSSAFSLPRLTIALLPVCSIKQLSRDELLARGWKNMGWISMLRLNSQSIGALVSPSLVLAWIKLASSSTHKVAKVLESQVLMHEVEAWFFVAASVHLSLNRNSLNTAFSVNDISPLELVVEAYRDIVNSFLKNTNCVDGRLVVELRSRETLVVWIACCVIDRSVLHESPLFRDYDIPLHINDLRHLSLSNKIAIDAMLIVCEYVRSRSASNRPVFSHLPNDATLLLAEQFSRQCPSILSTWDQEQRAASKRQELHWNEVLRKQAQARDLRLSIAELEQNLVQSKFEYDAVLDRNRVIQYSNSLLPRCSRTSEESTYVQKAAVQHTESAISKANSQLKDAEKSPPPVFQPLPSVESHALQALFLIYLPPLIRSFSKFSFMARQMVNPREWKSWVERYISGFGSKCASKLLLNIGDPARLATRMHLPAFKFNWATYYNSMQSCQYFKPVEVRTAVPYALAIGSLFEKPKSVDSSNVDALKSPESGVWHPNSISLELGWTGGGFAIDSLSTDRFNPFIDLPFPVLEVNATELLPSSFKDMQWAMYQFEFANVTPERGNICMASQEESPSWLPTKLDYFSFSNLRAFPELQLRKIVSILVDRSLPFKHPAVHTILRQALYHVGSIQQQLNYAVSLVWKTDLFSGDFSETVCNFLCVFLDELENTPRDHQSIVFATSLLSYVWHWVSPYTKQHVPPMPLRSAQISLKWAASILLRMEMLTSDYDIFNSRLELCRCYMYGILSFSGSFELSPEDIFCLLKLQLLMNYTQIYLDTSVHHLPQKMDATISADGLRILCYDVISSRHVELLQFVSTHMAAISEAVRAVLSWVPLSLIWSKLFSPSDPTIESSCYESYTPAPDAHQIIVNLLTGVILVDGNPPCSLPREIRNHLLFRRTFGERDFEVSPITDGATAGSLRTNRSLSGYTFEFFQYGSGNNSLMVKEIPVLVDAPILELLDGVAKNCDVWASDLPPRLREMHSHWICRDRGVILFRPVSFDQRDVTFIGLFEPKLQKVVTHPCNVYRVPLHLRSRPWQELVSPSIISHQICDYLVLWHDSTKLFDVLSRFEHDKFIHIYASSKRKGFTIEFPRFKIEFSLVDGLLQSNEFRGYSIRSGQWDNTLHGFDGYLLLEHRTKPVLMIVPQGEVQRVSRLDDSVAENSRVVWIADDTHCASQRSYHTFSEHSRFSELRASNVESRLMLASLFTAASTELPESRTSMTGVEIAIELVRRSYVDRPLSAGEMLHLRSIQIHSWNSPSLYILCHLLQTGATQLEFLYSASGAAHVSANVGLLQKNATCYIMSIKSQMNVRLRLKKSEELNATGLNLMAPIDTLFGGIILQSSLAPCPVVASFISDIEYMLESMSQPVMPSNSLPVCPIASNSADMHLSNEMNIELIHSWNTYHSSAKYTSLSLPNLNAIDCRSVVYKYFLRFSTLKDVSAPSLTTIFSTVFSFVQTKRDDVESYLLSALDFVPLQFLGSHIETIFRLRQAANFTPKCNLVDLCRIAWTPSLVVEFNPFIAASSSDCVTLFNGVNIWMQLCVLEDKMTRLLALVENTSKTMPTSEIIRELQSKRVWDPILHPEWLGYEVDATLQIRPVQYVVAAAMINNPASIVQLNMGEGKTRVILPMLFLHWTSPRSECQDCIIRLHFLPQLLNEGYEFMHMQLCASSLNRKMFLMPFNRDVELTPSRVRVMIEHANLCRREGGALFIAPESRCSLHLKRDELLLKICRSDEQRESQTSSIKLLAQFDSGLPWKDVFDESDEVLKHKYQLIYAVGDVQQLPALSVRVIVVHGLLCVLRRDPDVRKMLTNDIAVLDIGTDRPTEAFFYNLRFLPGPEFDRVLPALIHRIAKSLLDNPPHELKWLTGGYLSHADMIRYITDPSQDAAVIIKDAVFVETSHRDALLMLRGMLAYNMFLSHCLQKRHRVNYGTNNNQTSCYRKRLAIPFRACDVPSERSEFAHPDIAIVLTTIAYLSQGLDSAQVNEALNFLMTMGPNAQTEIYRSWFNQSRSSVSTEDTVIIDTFNKLDVSNSAQQTLMQRVFKFNMETIHFFLRYCVFPRDTMQYPQRLKASAWDLASYSHNTMTILQPVGFSGTNDNHRLYPLCVKQYEPNDSDLKSTNGKMLDVVLHYSTYQPLNYASDVSSSSAQSSFDNVAWKALLITCVETLGVNALIDSGALLAGVSNAAAAEFVLAILLKQSAPKSSSANAVVYFDDSEWVVLNQHHSIVPLVRSPIREHEAFVIFSERHCRGADMKLNRDACAVLTLGITITKDKFMQAAGRMRRLGVGQTLTIVAQYDVHHAICDSTNVSCGAAISGNIPRNRVDVLSILRWIMANTVVASETGLLEWASNGVHHANTMSDCRNDVMLDEIMLLDDLYCSAVTRESVSSTVARVVKARVIKHDTNESQGILRQRIANLAATYGSETFIAVSAAEEECERELEKEVEIEKEVERQVPRKLPVAEREWTGGYAQVLNSGLTKSFLQNSNSISLSECVKTFLKPESLNTIDWAKRVFATQNFIQTVRDTTDLSDYMRPVDGMLIFPDGEVLLLSERESNAMVCLMWSSDNESLKTMKAQFVQFFVVCPQSHIFTEHQSSSSSDIPPLLLPCVSKRTIKQCHVVSLTPRTINSIHLYNGKTMFGAELTHQYMDDLYEMLTFREARSAALTLPEKHGMRQTIERSNLQSVCEFGRLESPPLFGRPQM